MYRHARGLGWPGWLRVVWAPAIRVRAYGITFYANHQCVGLCLVFQRLDAALEVLDLVLEVVDVVLDVVPVRRIYPLREAAVT